MRNFIAPDNSNLLHLRFNSVLFIYFSIYLYFQMKVIWLKQLNSLYLDMREMFLLTILKQYYITIDHYYPECPRLYTIILSYLLVHMWNLITCLISVYVELSVYLLSSFFYILCWRGRYVEANTAEFDLILPLSLSWCNLCGRNRATGTHISAFVLINLNFVYGFTLFYFITNLISIFLKLIWFF